MQFLRGQLSITEKPSRMKFRFRLLIRMLVLILSISVLIFYISSNIISKNFKKVAYSEAFETNSNEAAKLASIIKTNLNKDFDKIRTIAQLMQTNTTLDWYSKRDIFNNTTAELVRNNTDFVGIWDSWELRFVDNNWDLPYGRITNYQIWKSGHLEHTIDSLDLDGDDFENNYAFIKLLPEEAIENPVWHSYTGKSVDKIFKTSLMMPILVNDEFAGIVGAELNLTKYNQLLDSLSSTNAFDIMFFSFNGDIIYHPNKNTIGSNIIETDTLLARTFSILDRIQSGENSSFTLKSKSGIDSLNFAISSFKIANTATPWCVVVSAPLITIESQIDSMLKVVVNAGILGLVIIIIVIFFNAIGLISPLQKTTELVKKLAGGDVHNVKKLVINTADETKDMADSTNTVIDGLNQVTNFAENIGNGNYSYEFNQLSKEDILGRAILEMRNSLASAREEEKQRIVEEENMNWASQGMNIFNKILRVDNQNLENLTYSIIETITIYLGAHMGGIYLKSRDDSDIYELISHIGFSKEKFNKKNIKPGEGEIGRCILEKDTIFINEVPKYYAKITSGLGQAIPSSILIVPLISNLKMIGVLELESLKEMHQYQIEFVDKLAETIASTIATVKVNVRTAQLLDRSQKQAEELEQQEEEMRQNMEEMQATQEEATKREMKLSSLIGTFKAILLVSEYDYNGKLIEINNNYLSLLKLPKAQLIGKKHKSDLFMDDEEQKKHIQLWEDLKNGIVSESVEYYKSGKRDFWIQESYLPIKNQHGIVQRILCVGIDITEQRKTESEIKRIAEGRISQINEEKDLLLETVNEVDFSIKLEVIDLTYLKMLYKKDAQKIYNILKLYYETLPPQLLELEDINNSRDYKRLKSRINSLKTKMSYIGLKAIYEEFRNIERLLIDNKNLSKVSIILNKIKKHWAVAAKELGLLLEV